MSTTEAGLLGLTVQRFETWSATSHLLSRSVLDRLCGTDLPTNARRAHLDQSRVMVVTYQDEPIGFAAYKVIPAGMRVAHEVWVDADAPCGLEPVASMLLGHLERDAIRSRCSKLFLIVPPLTPLRGILGTRGYTITLEGADVWWFEKALDTTPEGGG